MSCHCTSSNQLVKHDGTVRKEADGFSLIELLVVIVVLALLLSLSIVGVQSARASARANRGLADMRSVAGAAVQYASDCAELPPTLFHPPERWPETFQTTRVAGVDLTGAWFANTSLFYMLFEPFLPEAVLRAGFSWPQPRQTDRGMTVDCIPYRLTSTLYAAPEYWLPERQRPLLGWKAQRMDSVALPSSKGMCWIPRYQDPATLPAPGQLPRPTVIGVRQSPPVRIAWFDLSVTDTPFKDLVPGVANRFSYGVDPIRTTRYDEGPAVDSTLWGLAGFDRK